MSGLSKKSNDPGRRARVRRQVGVTGSVATIHGSKSVFVEDLCPNGARLLGRHLPDTGEEILLRTSELAVLARIAWASHERRGVSFEEGDRPSAGLCLGLQLRSKE